MGLIAHNPLRATHTVSAIVAEIAVAVAYGDGTAIVATRGIALEACELIATSTFFGAQIHASSFENCGIDIIRLTVGRVAVGFGFCFAGLVGFGRSWPRWPAILLGDGLGSGFLVPLFFRTTGRQTLARLAIPGDKGDCHPTEDIVDNALGDSNIGIRCVSHWLKSSMGELVHQDFQRNAILQAHRDSRAEAVHQATDG